MFISAVFGRSFGKFGKSLVISLSAVCVAFGLSSCATTTRYPLEPATIKARGLQSNEGYIVATFKEMTVTSQGGQGTQGGMCKVIVNGVGGLKETKAELVPFVMPVNRMPNLSIGEYYSEVIAIPVPAGDYEINGWRLEGSVTNQLHSGTRLVKNRLPMKVPFRVKAGEATYVGHYLAVSISDKNLLNRATFADGFMLAKNDFSKDQARIAKYYPSIKNGAIRKSNAADVFMAEMKRIADVPRAFWELF